MKKITLILFFIFSFLGFNQGYAQTWDSVGGGVIGRGWSYNSFYLGVDALCVYDEVEVVADVDHFYCYSFEPSDAWTEYFAQQPELQAYFERVMVKHGVDRHVRWETEVLERRGTTRRPRGPSGAGRPTGPSRPWWPGP